jgi:hypothetical protein
MGPPEGFSETLCIKEAVLKEQVLARVFPQETILSVR